MRRVFAAIFLVNAALASAAPAATPFELNPDRFDESGLKSLGRSDTYFIPSVYLMLSAHGSVWAQKRGAQAKGKYFVDGLSKDFVQGLARTIHEDLITKLRDAGYKVLTYDDLKDDPEIAGRDRHKADKEWGLPTRKDNGGTTFLVGAPSDAQAIEYGFTGPVHSYAGLAKDKNVVMIVPEIWFTAPQLGTEVSAGYKTATAGIVIQPAMKLFASNIYFVDPKKGEGSILIKTHGVRLAAESAGTISKLSEVKTDFETGPGVNEWRRTSADYGFQVDPETYSAGALRVGYAINDLIVQRAKKAH